MSIASLGNINLDGITAENPGGYQGRSFVYLVILSMLSNLVELNNGFHCASLIHRVSWGGWGRSGRMIMSIFNMNEQVFVLTLLLKETSNLFNVAV